MTAIVHNKNRKNQTDEQSITFVVSDIENKLHNEKKKTIEKKHFIALKSKLLFVFAVLWKTI